MAEREAERRRWGCSLPATRRRHLRDPGPGGRLPERPGMPAGASRSPQRGGAYFLGQPVVPGWSLALLCGTAAGPLGSGDCGRDGAGRVGRVMSPCRRQRGQRAALGAAAAALPGQFSRILPPQPPHHSPQPISSHTPRNHGESGGGAAQPKARLGPSPQPPAPPVAYTDAETPQAGRSMRAKTRRAPQGRRRRQPLNKLPTDRCLPLPSAGRPPEPQVRLRRLLRLWRRRRGPARGPHLLQSERILAVGGRTRAGAVDRPSPAPPPLDSHPCR